MNAVLTTGGEFRRFISDMEQAHGQVRFPRDEGETLDIAIEGKPLESLVAIAEIAADAQVTVEGFIAFGAQRGSWSLQRVFRDWQRGQSHVSRIVMVPQGKQRAFEVAVKNLGGTIIR